MLVEPAGREHVREHQLLVTTAVDAGILGQEAERAGDHHFAAVGATSARDGAQQRGLSGAVAADQSDFVARVDVERRARHQVAIADGHREPECANHQVRLGDLQLGAGTPILSTYLVNFVNTYAHHRTHGGPTHMQSHRPLRLLVGVLVAALALVTVAAPALAKTPQQSSETTTVRLGVFANVTHAPGLIAIESGLLQKALGPDVKLEVQYFNAGPAVITALLADAIDVSYIGPNPSITGFAQTNGEALRIISGSTSAGAALVVKPSITKVSDLKGKKIATPQLGNTQDVAARAYLKSKGLSTDTSGGGDVSIIPTANATTLTAFQQGNIDGAWVPEPWASRLVNEAGGKVLVDEASLWPGGQFVTTQLIAATRFIKDNPKTITKVLKGNIDAIDFANNNPIPAQKFVATGILNATGQKVDLATITNSWANLTFTIDPLAATLAKSAKDAESVGLLDKVNLEGIYDLKPLNKILRAQGKPVVSDKLDAAAATKTTKATS